VQIERDRIGAHQREQRDAEAHHDAVEDQLGIEAVVQNGDPGRQRIDFPHRAGRLHFVERHAQQVQHRGKEAKRIDERDRQDEQDDERHAALPLGRVRRRDGGGGAHVEAP
jgi:hypothetical protein